ncbi:MULTISPECIES: hypothetical protein [unclassified Pseudoxanthomonas]|uniref:hypothetical protein n=1 Tax=unclassified Pseudoxanthomonas TaxID=2645906 RepID=UPI00111379FF|nr:MULTISPECIES: hypothetical protein [unclassified Pseudoxanthomonas]
MDEFLANAALLAAHLKEQCERATASQQSSADDLRGAAIVVRRTIEEGKRELVEHAGSAVSTALAEKIPAATNDILETSARLKQVTDRFHNEQAALERRMRLLGTSTLSAIAVACAVLIAGTGYASWYNVKRAQRAHADAEVLDALRQVTITACDGAPCIKLEDGLRRWGKNRDYVLVDGRKESSGEPTGERQPK